MPITAAELQNIITGDDTQWQAVVRRTQESLISLESQAGRMSASVNTAFSSIGASVAPSFSAIESRLFQLVELTGAGFESMTEEITSAMARSSATTQASLAEINASLTNLQVRAVATGETITTALGGASSTVAQSTVEIGAGLSTLGQAATSAGASISDLAVRKANLMVQLAGVSRELKSELSVMTAAQEAARTLGGNSTQLNQVLADSQGKVAALAIKQQLLRNELTNVSAAMKGATIAQGAVGATTDALGQKTNILSALMQGHTTQITSQGTVWKGYDNVLQAVIRTMGGIPIIAALGITILGVLAEKMLHSKSAAKELKDVSDDLIRSDLLLVSAFSALQEATGSTTRSFIDQANAYRQLTEVDVGAVLVNFAEAFKQSREEIKKAEQALTDNQKAQKNWNDVMELAQGSTVDYTDSLRLAQGALDASGKSLTDETDARAKNDEKIRRQVDALLVLYNTGARTIPQLEEMGRAAWGAGEAFDRLQAELLKATSAQQQLNAAAASYRPPKLDATIQTYDQLRTAINANAADLEKSGRTQGEILIALKPQLEALKKVTIEKAAADLTSAGATLKNSAAQKLLADELKKGGDKAAEYAGKLPTLDKNIKALSSTTEQHAKAAGAARSAVSQYAEGVMGLSKAFDVVTNALRTGIFDKLFDELPAKARKGLDSVKQAAQTVVKELTDMLKRTTGEGGIRFGFDDKDLKPTIATLQQLGTDGVAQLQRVTEASKSVEEWLTKLKIAAINLKQPVFEIPFTALYDSMGKVRDGAKELVDRIKTAGGTIVVTFTDVSKAISESGIKSIDALNTSADIVEGWSNQWVKGIGHIKAALPPFQQALQDIKMQIEGSFAFDQQKISNEAAQAIETVIQEFEQGGIRLGKVGDDLTKYVMDGLHSVFGPQFTGFFKDIGAKTVEAWKDSLRGLPSPLNDALNKMLDALAIFASRSRERVKDAVSGILQVMNAIPGKLHDIAQTFLDWVNRIDQILKGLHKIFQSVPDGLGAVITQVIGIFKKSQQPIQDATDAVGDSLDDMQKKAKDAAQGVGGAMGDMADQTQAATAKATAAIGKYVTTALQMLGGLALIISGHAQGGISGALTGALGGALLGAKIGSLIAPGIGTLIGAGIGAIGGFFAGIFGGGGKSELQKAQEAAQLQQAKDAITISQQQAIQAVEQTKQSMIDTASKIRDLLESITFYTEIPKEAFTAFFHDLDKLMNKFAARAEAWSTDASAKIKAFSEDMQQVVAGLAAVPAILNGISAHLGVSDASIDRFFNDLGKVLIAFEAKSEDFTRKFLRKARIFAERIQETVGILPDIISAITGMVNIRPVPTANFDIFEQSLTEITNRIGKIATNFDKYTAKLIGFFATQIAPAVTLWKDAIDAIRSMTDLTPPAPEAFTALFNGIETVLNGMSELAGKIHTESLVRAQAIAIAAGTIFGAIKDGVDALKSLADFKTVAPEAFQALLDGFDEAIAILNQLLEKATSFESIAAQIEAKLKSAAEHMAAGAVAMAAALSKGGSTTGGTVGVSGLTPTPTSVAVSAGSQPISVSVTVQGSLIHQAQLEDVIVSAIKNATTRGRNTMGIGWPGPIAKTI